MVDISRRAALGVGAALVGGLLVAADPETADAATKAQPAATAKPAAVARQHYASSVGKPFTATRDGVAHRVVLSHIRTAPRATAAQANVCFILVFTAAGRLPEGIYTLTRRGVQTHALFLGHVGRGNAMQAVVNRSR